MKKRSVNNSSVVKKDLNEAVDAILQGVDGMFKEERKFNLRTFATKDELGSMNGRLGSVKDELKTEMSWIRDDIKGLKADLSKTPSKSEFNQLKGKVEKYLSS